MKEPQHIFTVVIFFFVWEADLEKMKKRSYFYFQRPFLPDPNPHAHTYTTTTTFFLLNSLTRIWSDHMISLPFRFSYPLQTPASSSLFFFILFHPSFPFFLFVCVRLRFLFYLFVKHLPAVILSFSLLERKGLLHGSTQPRQNKQKSKIIKKQKQN